MRRLCSVTALAAVMVLASAGGAQAAGHKPPAPPGLNKVLTYPAGYGACYGTADATTCVNTVQTFVPGTPQPSMWVVCYQGGYPAFVVEPYQTTVVNHVLMEITTTTWVLVRKTWQLLGTSVEHVDSVQAEDPVQLEACAANNGYVSAGPYMSAFEAQQVATEMSQYG